MDPIRAHDTCTRRQDFRAVMKDYGDQLDMRLTRQLNRSLAESAQPVLAMAFRGDGHGEAPLQRLSGRGQCFRPHSGRAIHENGVRQRQ